MFCLLEKEKNKFFVKKKKKKKKKQNYKYSFACLKKQIQIYCFPMVNSSLSTTQIIIFIPTLAW
jgi:hypothetical protein